jgi:hypothetical protein
MWRVSDLAIFLNTGAFQQLFAVLSHEKLQGDT